MKTDVTVISQDKFISVDGEGIFFDFDIPEGLEEYHAIQWHNGKGHKELLETMENVAIDNYEKDVEPYVLLWENEKNRLDEIYNRPLTLEETKEIKLSEINSLYNEATSSLISEYPDTEIMTFNIQEKEARAYKNDNSTETPFLSELASERGISLDEIVELVIKKSDTFYSSVSKLTGQRQKYKDMLENASSIEEVNAIIPEYKL